MKLPETPTPGAGAPGGGTDNDIADRRHSSLPLAQTRPEDLIAYARKHRHRVRNIHDGGPVPPARYMKPKGQASAAQAGFIGKDDRYDAIVGYDGYVCDEGNGRLGVYLCYKSSKGVKRAQTRIQALAGAVAQVGDIDIAGNVPVDRIEDALKLIRVSKVPMRNPNPTFGLV